MRTLRAIFLRLQLREKLLLVAFILMIAAVWFSNFNRRAWTFARQARTATADLKIQQQWLDNQATIEADVKKTAARLDPARTLDATSLVAAIDAMARDAGVTLRSLGQGREETNGQFNVHTQEFQIDKAEYPALLKFYMLLEAKSPYVGLERLTLQPDRMTPALSQVQFLVSAPEVVKVN
jgi:hypothetical protein